VTWVEAVSRLEHELFVTLFDLLSTDTAPGQLLRLHDLRVDSLLLTLSRLQFGRI
jgi:hypothetical protein